MSPSPHERFPTLFTPRAPDSHKGSHGTLAIIGGAEGMSGALVLAASAALMSGCGRVFAAFCQARLPAPWLPPYPEIMLATSENIFSRAAVDTWAIGCGLGTGELARHALAQSIRHSAERRQALLLDADALNLLASHEELAQALSAAAMPKVLTPHPGEAARLLHTSVASVQGGRLHSATSLARRYHAWVVLKGHATIVAGPDGETYCNDSGNAALATAGSGDVLSGMIAALLAQGMNIGEAVCGGVWLHGAAADEYTLHGVPLAGLLASDIAPAARRIRQRLCAQYHSGHCS